MPTIEILQQTNPEFDREELLDLVALYRGGKCFSSRVMRFLPKNDHEPDGRYLNRVSSARYFNYIGPIIDRFSASLIQVPPSITAGKDSSLPDEWREWQANVNGCGTDLSELAREMISDALMKRRTFLAVEKPVGTAETLADWKAKGLDEIRVRELETQCVLDWGRDESTGELLWLIHHDISSPRVDPLGKRSRCVETWTVYTSESVDTYQIEYEHGARPGIETEVPLVSSEPHGLGRVPVVVFEVSEGMWLASRARDAQVEHFTQRSALNWALKASCYAMPMFHLEDANVPPVMGTGTGLTLGANDHVDWLAPPSAPFDVMAHSIESCREELYRMVHQMAEGVSSTASNSAKSAKSKQADLIATRAILEAYAVVLRDALMRIVDLVAAFKGEDASELSISGMDKFADVDIESLFAAIEKANSIGMPSDTYQEKVRETILDAVMPQLDESTRGAIIDELKGGIADLKKKDELEARYQEALAHAITEDTAQRSGKPKAANRGDGGGIVDNAPAANAKKPPLRGPAKT